MGMNQKCLSITIRFMKVIPSNANMYSIGNPIKTPPKVYEKNPHGQRCDVMLIKSNIKKKP